MQNLRMSLTPKEKSATKSKNPFMRETNQPKATISSIIKSRKKQKQKQTAKQLMPPTRHRKSAVLGVNAKIELKTSKTEENIKKLFMFNSAVQFDNETTQKMIKRAQTQKYVIPEPKAKENQATVFTDEDFKKFEREYFCS